MKLQKITALALLLALFALLLTGCYQIKAATPDEIFGSYELTTYTKTTVKKTEPAATEPADDGKTSDGNTSDGNTAEEPAPESTSETEDMLKTKGVVSYLVVCNSAKGYYYYKDDETPAACYEVTIRLTESSEENEKGKFTYLEFAYGDRTVKLGIRGPGFFRSTNLNATDTKWSGSLLNGTLHSTGNTHTVFTRRNKTTDLSFLEKKVGKVTVIPAPAAENEAE